MKKILLMLMLVPAITYGADNNRLFAGFSLGYSAVMSPHELENNSTGVYDWPGIQAAAGIELFGVADIYGGASYYLFVNRTDAAMHISFLPVFAGIGLKAPIQFFIKPELRFEIGTSFSNEHVIRRGFTFDYPWNGLYYNFGAVLEIALTSILYFDLFIDRPSVAGRDGGEFHVIRSGAGWKVCM